MQRGPDIEADIHLGESPWAREDHTSVAAIERCISKLFSSFMETRQAKKTLLNILVFAASEWQAATRSLPVNIRVSRFLQPDAALRLFSGSLNARFDPTIVWHGLASLLTRLLEDVAAGIAIISRSVQVRTPSPRVSVNAEKQQTAGLRKPGKRLTKEKVSKLSASKKQDVIAVLGAELEGDDGIDFAVVHNSVNNDSINAITKNATSTLVTGGIISSATGGKVQYV
ncbi:hypothetical protein Tdes44962_MAKER06522 [Teratosphaeria destructans]|uniref:Uncharacterized protein n=1 Tax=Teratosphaeria destructans TaxID=418781 RepID=A0A9W7T1I4_9PEZI|nr:hypothetical protein Tdes44962_MAKER06522 [Teratosphaeria destructans]